MKKILIILSLVYTMSYGHQLLMNIFDNEDNTITVEGLYSSGQKTSGAMLRVESLISGEILFKKRFPQDGELIIKIPKEPYQVVLDGGPGHIVVEKGIAPKEGFSKEIITKIKKSGMANISIAQSSNREWENTTIFLFSLCILLLSLSIYFSNQNTKKIYKLIEDRNAR